MTKRNPYAERPTKQSVLHFIERANEKNPKFEADYEAVAAFFKKFRRNDALTPIYLKTHLVNSIFNTRIRDVYNHALGIHQRVERLDERLKAGDESLVNEIATYKMKGKRGFRFYSFATKYCHCHSPKHFPIYDSYVADSLVQFKKYFRFAVFNRPALRIDYGLFKEVLDKFRVTFGLTGLSAREIDRFLWKMG